MGNTKTSGNGNNFNGINGNGDVFNGINGKGDVFNGINGKELNVKTTISGPMGVIIGAPLWMKITGVVVILFILYGVYLYFKNQDRVPPLNQSY